MLISKDFTKLAIHLSYNYFENVLQKIISISQEIFKVMNYSIENAKNFIGAKTEDAIQYVSSLFFYEKSLLGEYNTFPPSDIYNPPFNPDFVPIASLEAYNPPFNPDFVPIASLEAYNPPFNPDYSDYPE